MTPACPLGADTSPFASFFTPTPGIFALFTVLLVGVVYFLLHLARHGTRFISEELEEIKTVYHDAFARGILDFQLDSDRALDKKFHAVEDEASALYITFLAASPLLLPLMQLVSLIAIAQCAYNLRSLKKKIQVRSQSSSRSQEYRCLHTHWVPWACRHSLCRPPSAEVSGPGGRRSMPTFVDVCLYLLPSAAIPGNSF
ncbi:hypothetical protein B0H17DRAFT_284230 [Mycena rosella]|uniref:Uncharacterized protein n=1 Tax=Mycena rosella TaxID=1033263 RepID=A0AAD7CWR2_MYCRO|nr:hypothetical protein B0H17DRAFT_284230 [Mycena rosella]